MLQTKYLNLESKTLKEENILTELQISRSAILHNYNVFKSIVNQSLLMPVVKSNAYGHGLIELAKILNELNPNYYGVNSLTEAFDLLNHTTDIPILIMGNNGMEIPELNTLMVDTHLLKRLHFAISGIDGLEQLAKSPLLKELQFHLEIDTGISRLGINLKLLNECLSFIKENLSEQFTGVFTHFANIEDITEQDYAFGQIQLFNEGIKKIRQIFPKQNLVIHSAASAASLILPNSHFEMVRIGIALYGLWPSKQTKLSFYSQNLFKKIELKPALTWVSTLIHIQNIEKGVFVGYGCTFRAEREMCIGVVPVGYYEGYDRHLSNKAYTLVCGQRAAVVGRVSMNMICVDLTQIHEARIGSKVTLIGIDNNEKISADNLAEWMGTINYEVVSRLHTSIKRTIVD